MKTLITITAYFLFATSAFSGAACPHINIHDVGSPDWLYSTELLDGLESQATWVGVNSRPHDQGTELTRIATGSAAQSAGLLPRDIITAINGTSDLSFDGINSGETATLTINRDGTVIDIALTMGRADPVHFALGDVFESDANGCPNTTLSRASPILRRIIVSNVLTENRVFRCDDAHEALAFMGEDYFIGEAYLVRGSRRILLTIPHFGTACIATTDLDGDALTQENSLAFLMQAAASFIQYQEDNP